MFSKQTTEVYKLLSMNEQNNASHMSLKTQRKLTFHQSCLGNNILCVILNMRGAYLCSSYFCEAIKWW